MFHLLDMNEFRNESKEHSFAYRHIYRYLERMSLAYLGLDLHDATLRRLSKMKFSFCLITQKVNERGVRIKEFPSVTGIRIVYGNRSISNLPCWNLLENLKILITISQIVIILCAALVSIIFMYNFILKISCVVMIDWLVLFSCIVNRATITASKSSLWRRAL